MFRYRRLLSALTFAGILIGLPSAPALAGSSAQAPGAGCPSGTICDSTLGLALTVPPGWIQLPRGKFLPHTLAFGTRPTGLNYHLRLVIAPFAITSSGNDTYAARLIAGKLIQANRVPTAKQTVVTYAGSRGVLVRGLPGGPGPSADIFLARNGHVYQIIAPGASLAPDQRQALASLRFIPRSGNFLPPVGGGR